MFCRKLLSTCPKCSKLICSSQCWKEIKKCCFLLQLQFIVVCIASSVRATQPADRIAQSWSFSVAVHISAARRHQISHTGLPVNSKSAAIFPAPFLVSASPSSRSACDSRKLRGQLGGMSDSVTAVAGDPSEPRGVTDGSVQRRIMCGIMRWYLSSCCRCGVGHLSQQPLSTQHTADLCIIPANNCQGS